MLSAAAMDVPESNIYCDRPDFVKHNPQLKRSLGVALIEALQKQGKKELIVDYTSQRKAIAANTFLAVACRLAQYLQKEVPEHRVGVLLPPGIGGFLANVAIVLAGKVPVNLNFTLGRKALQACIVKAEIRTTLSAHAMRERLEDRFPDLPWSEHVVDLPSLLSGFSKPSILWHLLRNRWCSADSVARSLGIALDGGDREAAILFTSGSDGDPKGVVLTHYNILSNVAQVEDSQVLPGGESILANLPIFHSFGFTVTIWCALLKGIQVVTVSSPLEIKQTAEAIAAERVGVLLGTPTFFRPYLHKVAPEALQSLKIVVGGAEKTPPGFIEMWESRFSNSQYLEGYGLTETTPVVSVNAPRKNGQLQRKLGSTGKVFPGIRVLTLDPDTREVLPVGETGVLAFQGPNIFKGYLNDPQRTAAVFDRGWFVSGDLGRVDADGFLYIEGRLSRFSKIGGEMVPHGTVEQAVIEALELEDEEQPTVMVTARPDEQKGESLVLLTTRSITQQELREKLAKRGFSNLWIPREIHQVDSIPTLASGKLDIRRCQELAGRK